MKKLIAIFLCIIMVISLLACSSKTVEETTVPNETEQTTEGASVGSESADAAVNLEAVKDEMIAEFGIKDPISLNNSKLLDQYGITEETIASQCSFIVMTGVFPAEIVMVEAVDENAAADIRAKLQSRLDNLKVQSQSYDADSYAIATACEVETEGNYVALFFSEHNEGMVEIFNEHF